jgi:alkylated DNA repair dioxygenase AlkB
LIEILHQGPARAVLVESAFGHLDFDAVRDDIQWRQNSIRVYGKIHLEPRLTAWYGPEYRYSSIHWPAATLSPLTRGMIERVQEIEDFPFNAVLCNYYRDGNDGMGWHRDNEPEMDQRLIASVSIGATRTFQLRNRTSGERIDIPLTHGSLLFMHNLQNDWEHAVPKRKKVIFPRINFTFRHIFSPK